MSTQQLESCIELGESIAQGKVDLEELDRLSLTARGKILKGEKRKRESRPGDAAPLGTKKPKNSARSQGDIRAAMGAPPPTPPRSPSPAPIDQALSLEITSHPTLTLYRKRVLVSE